MAHRIIWRSRYNDNVIIHERDKKIRGVCDHLAEPLKVRVQDTVRVYEVREWLTALECRATLIDTITAAKDTR